MISLGKERIDGFARHVEEILIYERASEEDFRNRLYPLRRPLILRGLDIGSCRDKWTPEYLAKAVSEDRTITAHVTTTPAMDFVSKNFLYKTLPFSTLVRRSASEVHLEFFFSDNEKYYLRSLGSNPRKNVANIASDFPELIADFRIPRLFTSSKFFSSIFRIGSSGIQIWTHYDVMDNALIQIRGRKRVVLFSPEDALNMYLVGDKSRVINIDDPDLERFPDFVKAIRYEGVLEPGDVLFIPGYDGVIYPYSLSGKMAQSQPVLGFFQVERPQSLLIAMWFHNTRSLGFNVAINVFWKHLDESVYNRKDIYGNQDLIPATRALEFVHRAIKLLKELPPEYRDFYGRRLVNNIRDDTFVSKT